MSLASSSLRTRCSLQIIENSPFLAASKISLSAAAASRPGWTTATVLSRRDAMDETIQNNWVDGMLKATDGRSYALEIRRQVLVECSIHLGYRKCSQDQFDSSRWMHLRAAESRKQLVPWSKVWVTLHQHVLNVHLRGKPFCNLLIRTSKCLNLLFRQLKLLALEDRESSIKKELICFEWVCKCAKYPCSSTVSSSCWSLPSATVAGSNTTTTRSMAILVCYSFRVTSKRICLFATHFVANTPLLDMEGE